MEIHDSLADLNFHWTTKNGLSWGLYKPKDSINVPLFASFYFYFYYNFNKMFTNSNYNYFAEFIVGCGF